MDTSFGVGGVSVVSLANERVFGDGGAIQPNGKAIITGQIRPSSGAAADNDLLLARLNTDGSLDSSFGTDGVVTQDVDGEADIGQTVTVDQDGDILVGGSAGTPAGQQLVVARFTPDGALDTSFGNGGFYVSHFFSTPLDEQVSGLAVQPDGKIVAVDANLNGRGGFALFRLNADGSLDTTFAHSGVTTVSLDPSTLGYSVAIAPDGEAIYVGGEQDARMAAWKFLADGRDDGNYGVDGYGVGLGTAPASGTGDVAYGLVVERGGAVVLAGGRGFTNKPATSNEAFAVERLDASGHLDPTFGTKGLSTLQVGPHDDEIESLLQSAGGKLVAVGYTATAETASSYTPQFAAARFTATGAVDTTFAPGGKFVVKKGDFSLANGGGLLRDGRVIAFGYSSSGGVYSAEAVRYTPPPAAMAVFPSVATAGDTVELSGAGFTDGSAVKVGGVSVPAEDVTYVSPIELDVVLPDSAETGKVTVTTDGTVLTSAALKVKPRIDSIDGGGFPTAGVPFDITGGGFAGVTSVKVAGITWKVRFDSASHLTVTAPANAVPGTLVLAVPGETVTSADIVGLTPTVTSFAPRSGKAGTTVTIRGTSLLHAIVSFGGVNATTKSSTATSVTVVVPVGASTGALSIWVPYGEGTTSGPTFDVLPSITHIAEGQEGQAVALSGAGLGDVTGVSFAGVATDFTPVSSGEVDAVVPEGPTATGTWKVTTASGTATSATYTIAPLITGFSPDHAPPGARVTISGSGFVGVKSVKLNGGSLAVAATFKVDSTTEITMTVPVTEGGGVTLAAAGGVTYSEGFTMDSGITSFSPTVVRTGTKLTITGTLLGAVTDVVFDAGSADAVSAVPDSVSQTKVVVEVPPGAHPGPVGVTGHGMSGVSSKPLMLSESIYDFSPERLIPGDTVTITGIGLAGATAVAFGSDSSSVTPTSVSDSAVTAVVPSGVTNGFVMVTTAAGTVRAQDVELAVTTRNEPNGAQVNDELNVYGEGLDEITSVDVPDGSGGSISADFSWSKSCPSECLHVTLPAGAHAGYIYLFDSQGNSVRTQYYYLILAVDSLSEASWSPGDTVTVTGSWFTTGVKATLNGESCPIVQVTDPSSFTFTVPADARNGHLVVSTEYGTLDVGEFDQAGSAAAIGLSPERVAQSAR